MSNTAQNYTIPVVGHFEKVSLSQFKNAIKDEFGSKWSDDELDKMWNDLKKPSRATEGSCGYDFYAPFDFTLRWRKKIKIPTGIGSHINPGVGTFIFPKSGLGSKYFFRIANTIPAIDMDYVRSKNEGHIFVTVRNEGSVFSKIKIKKGDKIFQGVNLFFGIMDDDNATEKRDGGFGSTGR